MTINRIVKIVSFYSSISFSLFFYFDRSVSIRSVKFEKVEETIVSRKQFRCKKLLSVKNCSSNPF